MNDVAVVGDDLSAEQQVLDDIVGDLTDEGWRAPTPSAGWTVADQIGHLTYFDAAAVLAIRDPERFMAEAAALMAALERLDERTLHRHLDPGALLATWRANRRALAEAAAGLADGERVVWYGPSMSARSFLTARLMETWAHGQDVADAIGVEREPTDRLRHIAQLGVITRAWSYVNRGLEPPTSEVRVDLQAPSGARWRWGPEEAEQLVRGPALDFCLVVTQRRHVAETALEVTGADAADWMERAQAFAGPPTTTATAR